VNKLGLHIIGGYAGELGRPRVVKLVEVSVEYVREVRRKMGRSTLIVVRWVEAEQLLDDPARRAREWFARHEKDMLAMAAGDANTAFEGYNEVDTGRPEHLQVAQAYCAFEVERLRLMQACGLKSVVGNFSVGQPHESLWPAFQPMLDALRPGDYLGLHEYWENAGELDNKWLCGRWMRPEIAPYLQGVPIVVTECGRGAGGWLASANPEQYLQELEKYHGILEASPNVAGATVFTTGWQGWESYYPDSIWGQVVSRYAGEPAGEEFAYSLRNAAWNAGGIPYNPDAAFPRFARELGLGNPETPEFDFCLRGTWYRGQGFSLGIVYAPIGQWQECDFLPW